MKIRLKEIILFIVMVVMIVVISLSNDEIRNSIVNTSNVEEIIVSVVPEYNLKLARNGTLAKKTTVDYGAGNTTGRMYGYGLLLQLYNENESKGLKGIEYPQGEISFDLNLKLERSEFASTQLEDITNECTPILWNYRINTNTNTGNIPDRNMLFGNIYSRYYRDMPYGSKLGERRYSVGYLQLFVPDNEASTMGDRNYYLTVENTNFKATSKSGIETTEEMITGDDSSRINHVLYKPGIYNQQILISKTWEDKVGNFQYLGSIEGDSSAPIGQL